MSEALKKALVGGSAFWGGPPAREGELTEALAGFIRDNEPKPARAPYRSAFLPLSAGADGGVSLDWSAGLPGALWNAFTYPGDVMAGRAAPDDIPRLLETAGLLSLGPLGAPRGAIGSGMTRRPTVKAKPEPDLPMDDASRLARAEDGGFRMDLPLYHGTDQNFTGFDLSRAEATTRVAPAQQGVWMALDPATAEEFAKLAAGRSQGNAQIYPLRHSAAKRGVIELDGDEKNLEIAATLAQAWDDGYDAVMLKNYTMPGVETGRTILVVKDPSQLRSPWAKFDPAKRDSNDLLSAGGLPLPPGYISEEEHARAVREGRGT